MKDTIVLIATIILGVAIAGFIIGFKTPVETKIDSAKSQITNLSTSVGAVTFEVPAPSNTLDIEGLAPIDIAPANASAA